MQVTLTIKLLSFRLDLFQWKQGVLNLFWMRILHMELCFYGKLRYDVSIKLLLITLWFDGD